MARARERVREINDRIRTEGPGTNGNVRWLMTPGIRALGEASTAEAIRCVRGFNAFDDANDPHGEHDFGSFKLSGESLFWKIDYYDQALQGHSSDPADEGQTVRVLTIMLASEY